MRDKLLGALIGLARATENNETLITEMTTDILKEGLRATMPEVSYSEDKLSSIYDRVMTEKKRIIPSCFTCATPCGRTDNYDMNELWEMDEEIRAIKLVLLSGIQNLAHLKELDSASTFFLYKGLLMIGIYWDVDGLIPFLTELGNIMYKKIR